MNIHKATQSYENWMRSCTAVIEAHLRLKHKQMRESPFLFFRGTFYRWAQLWPDVCASLRDAPTVLAVGEMNIQGDPDLRNLDSQLYSRHRSPPAIEAQANERKPIPLFPRDVLPVGSTLAGRMRQSARCPQSIGSRRSPCRQFWNLARRGGSVVLGRR